MKLRPNVKFHPPISRALTTDDVIYSFNRYVGDVPSVPISPEAGDTKRIFASWTATDARTVRSALKQPQANVLYRLASTYSPYLMPQGADQLYKPDTTAMGTEPWILDQAQQDVRMLFRRNSEWHFGPERPYMDGFDIRFTAVGVTPGRRRLCGK